MSSVYFHYLTGGSSELIGIYSQPYFLNLESGVFVKSQRSEFQHEQWLGLDDVTIGAEIDQRVADGGLQIGISTDRGKIKAVRFLPLYQEYGCLYCGASHPLFGLEDVDITLELVNQQRFAQHAYSEAEIRDEQLVGFSPVASGQFTEGIALLILSGNFIGFLPEHYARNWVESGQMRQLLPAHVRKTTKIRLLYGAGASETPLVSAFVGTAKKVNDALGQSSSVSD